MYTVFAVAKNTSVFPGILNRPKLIFGERVCGLPAVLLELSERLSEKRRCALTKKALRRLRKNGLFKLVLPGDVPPEWAEAAGFLVENEQYALSACLAKITLFTFEQMKIAPPDRGVKFFFVRATKEVCETALELLRHVRYLNFGDNPAGEEFAALLYREYGVSVLGGAPTHETGQIALLFPGGNLGAMDETAPLAVINRSGRPLQTAASVPVYCGAQLDFKNPPDFLPVGIHKEALISALLISGFCTKRDLMVTGLIGEQPVSASSGCT